MTRFITSFAALVVVGCFVGCERAQTISIDTIEQRADFAARGVIPSTLALGATLTWDPSTSACTITTSSMPIGTVDSGWLLEGKKRWLITSTSPVVLRCP